MQLPYIGETSNRTYVNHVLTVSVKPNCPYHPTQCEIAHSYRINYFRCTSDSRRGVLDSRTQCSRDHRSDHVAGGDRRRVFRGGSAGRRLSDELSESTFRGSLLVVVEIGSLEPVHPLIKYPN